MDTDLALPSYVTLRNGVFYFVRRIPDDLTAVFGRRKRIQRSHRTAVQAKALSDAARINDEVERQLSEARAKIGIAVELGDVSEWTAEDWKQAAAWFEARLIEDDLEKRLPSVKGAALSGAARLQTEHWSDADNAQAATRRHDGRRLCKRASVARQRASAPYRGHPAGNLAAPDVLCSDVHEGRAARHRRLLLPQPGTAG